MKITRIFLKQVEGPGRLKAIGSITFDEEFAVNDVGVVDGKNGLFLSMPSRKDAEGKYRNLAFPVNREFRAEITEAVLEQYRKLSEETADEEEVTADE